MRPETLQCTNCSLSTGAKLCPQVTEAVITAAVQADPMIDVPTSKIRPDVATDLMHSSVVGKVTAEAGTAACARLLDSGDIALQRPA